MASKNGVCISITTGVQDFLNGIGIQNLNNSKNDYLIHFDFWLLGTAVVFVLCGCIDDCKLCRYDTLTSSYI